MATYHAISAIGQSIVALLKAARLGDDFPAIDIKLFHARDFQKSGEWEGISIYLYRVALSATGRQGPSPTAPSGRAYRHPLPLDLFYVLTPWAKTPEMQHLLLGWAMRAIEDTPLIPPSLLNAQIDHTFRHGEAVTLLHDFVSVQDMTSLWEIGKPNIQVSAAYVARVVRIDSQLETPPDGGGPVQTLAVAAGPLEAT